MSEPTSRAHVQSDRSPAAGMSQRERWIVYPLLFLALGIALRDKMSGTIDTGTIVCERVLCQRLNVGPADGPPGVVIGSERLKQASAESEQPPPVFGFIQVRTAGTSSRVKRFDTPAQPPRSADVPQRSALPEVGRPPEPEQQQE